MKTVDTRFNAQKIARDDYKKAIDELNTFITESKKRPISPIILDRVNAPSEKKKSKLNQEYAKT